MGVAVVTSAFVAAARVMGPVCRWVLVGVVLLWFVSRVCFADLFLVSRIVAEAKRIDAEEEVAENDFRERRRLMAEKQELLRRAQQDLDESLARLDRLRKQKRQIFSKGREMTVRAARDLDELEELDRRDSEVATSVQSLGGFGVIDWSAVDLSSLDSVLVDPGSGGDTAEVLAGSSGGAS